MDKYHTLFLSDNGSVYSCGFGVGGRLGHDNEEPVLVWKNLLLQLQSLIFIRFLVFLFFLRFPNKLRHSNSLKKQNKIVVLISLLHEIVLIFSLKSISSQFVSIFPFDRLVFQRIFMELWFK